MFDSTCTSSTLLLMATALRGPLDFLPLLVFCPVGEGVKTGHAVQDLLRDAKRRGNGDLRASRVLELQDDMGFTPLLAAAAKGHVQCVNLVRIRSW